MMYSVANILGWLVKTAGILSLGFIAFLVSGAISLIISDTDLDDDDDYE
jgi:hypothetical protein